MINGTLLTGVWNRDHAVVHCMQQKGRRSDTGGALEATERLLVKWHEDEEKLSRQRYSWVVGVTQGNRGRGGNKSTRKPDRGNGGSGGSRKSGGNLGWKRQEGDGRQDSKAPSRLLIVGGTCSCYSYRQLVHADASNEIFLYFRSFLVRSYPP